MYYRFIFIHDLLGFFLYLYLYSVQYLHILHDSMCYMAHLTVQVQSNSQITLFYLFGVLRRFQHCTGYITTGSWKGRGNQYI